MLSQLLGIEIIVKLAAGLALLAGPRMLARLLGLAAAPDPFWPRVAGALLTGLAIAAAVESQWLPGKALGLAGHAAINLTAAAVLGGLLILGRTGALRRGRALLGLVAAALALLGLIEVVALG